MTDTIEHTATRETLWVTDAELIRRSGVPEKTMRRLLREFDRNPAYGFPRKDKQWGDRRYWPAIQDYWREEQRRKMQPPQLRRAS